MEKEKLKLSAEQHHDLCIEGYYTIEADDTENADDVNVDVEFKTIQDEYEYSGRHQEYWTKVVQRNFDKKYFRLHYSTSVKDTMDWYDCNNDFDMIEVWPTQKIITIYE